MTTEDTTAQNDFWELDDLKIAHLSDQEMDRLERLELASQGKIPPGDAPELRPVPEVETGKTEEWFEVGGIVFRTRDQAETFMGLEPHTSESDYRLSWKNKVKHPKAVEGQISTVHLVPEEKFTELLDAMVERDQISDANATKKEEWEKGKREATDLLKKMREKRFECQDELAHAHRVDDTLQEYTDLTKGDLLTAMRFLKKAFTEESITRSIEWISRGEDERQQLRDLLDEVLGEVAVEDDGEDQGDSDDA